MITGTDGGGESRLSSRRHGGVIAMIAAPRTTRPWNSQQNNVVRDAARSGP